MHQRLPTHLLLWNIQRVVRQDRPGSVFVQKSGHVHDDVQISALDAMDDGVATSEKCGIGIEEKMLEISSELNELVEHLTCLNALEEKNWKSDQKVVMNEDLVQNSAMNDKFVKNFVDECHNWSEGCDGSVHIQNWWMEQSANQ